MPFFSIIIPVYNRAHLIDETITSVLAQDFADFELVLVDDGSTDESVQTITKWLEKDARIRLEVLPENAGRCAARNKGLDLARGEWICYLDSDDLYYPFHLSEFHSLIETHPTYNAFASDQHINGHLKEYRRNALHSALIELTITDFIEDNPLTANQLCHRNLPDLRWSQLRIPISEDWLFIRELALKYPVLKKGIVTNFLRDHADRSMNTTEIERFVHFNLLAANEFAKQAKSGKLRRRVLSYTLILCANVYLSEKRKKEAWPLFRKSLAYANTYRYALLYKAVVKFFL